MAEGYRCEFWEMDRCRAHLSDAQTRRELAFKAGYEEMKEKALFWYKEAMALRVFVYHVEEMEGCPWEDRELEIKDAIKRIAGWPSFGG